MLFWKWKGTCLLKYSRNEHLILKKFLQEMHLAKHAIILSMLDGLKTMAQKSVISARALIPSPTI